MIKDLLKLILGTTVAVAVFCTSVYVGSASAQTGLSIGVNAGMALSTNANVKNVTNVTNELSDSTENAFVGTVYGEYNWKYFGAGAGFTTIPEMDINGAKIDYSMPELYVTARLPISDFATIYTKGGGAYILADGSGIGNDDHASAFAGVGMQIDLTSNFAVNLDLKHYFDAFGKDGYDSDLSTAQVGIAFGF